MAMEEAIELVFIPGHGMGHLVSAVGTAKHLLQRSDNLPRLSITVLIMKLPLAPDSKINTYIDSLLADNDNSRLKIKPLDVELQKEHYTDLSSFFSVFFECQRIKVRECVNEIIHNSACVRIAGFVIDILSMAMMDVAEEFGVPTYVFYSSGAAFLGLHLHLLSLVNDQGIEVGTHFKDSDPDFNVPAYSKPFPVRFRPLVSADKLNKTKRIPEAKGIIVNTFLELEPHALEALSKDNKVPPIYPVGPILNLNLNCNEPGTREIFEWLNDQPAASVVFICFGSAGSFQETHMKEIAYALERSGQRFLWSLMKPSPAQTFLLPTEYSNPEEVLPEGFLERTKSIGKVIGWAPQAAVLSHPSVGGFVSHCGWNSILESIWFGVPIVTWPITADQPANAFLLTTDMGIAVDIIWPSEKVSAKSIEIGITTLMDQSATSSIRIKAKELKEKSRKALAEGSSSINFVESFFDHVINNLK